MLFLAYLATDFRFTLQSITDDRYIGIILVLFSVSAVVCNDSGIFNSVYVFRCGFFFGGVITLQFLLTVSVVEGQLNTSVGKMSRSHLR